jgi:hypothetical protein
MTRRRIPGPGDSYRHLRLGSRPEELRPSGAGWGGAKTGMGHLPISMAITECHCQRRAEEIIGLLDHCQRWQPQSGPAVSVATLHRARRAKSLRHDWAKALMMAQAGQVQRKREDGPVSAAGLDQGGQLRCSSPHGCVRSRRLKRTEMKIAELRTSWKRG